MVFYKNILLIEDDPDDQEFFLEILHSIDPLIHRCVVPNGRTALKYLRTTEPSPQLIFLDLNMPVMNGYEFLQCLFHDKVYQAYKNIPVIVLTTSKHEAKKSKEAGATFYLVKPPSVEQLRIMLSTVLTHDVAQDARMLQKLIKVASF
jgi:CheY-like chemotaxis protein